MVELAAPTMLSGAVGWAGWSLASPIAALAGGLAAWTLGYLLMCRVDGARNRLRLEAFEPAALDELAEAEGELLLDDPLTAPPEDSRVVRLFADAEPTPGELVARITDFLGDSGRLEPIAAEAPRATYDAGEALHAALANIRASLR